MKVAIHANPGAQWQRRYAEFFKTGFAKHGIAASVTQSAGRERGTDVAVLFGPNYWKQVERSGEPYLIVNRVLVSRNPRHVHDVVAISWDGLNGRGTFCVDDIDETRLEQFISPSKDVAGWRKQGDYLLLCGQADIGRCGRYGSVAEWYRLVENTANEPVVFRAHPNNGPRVPLRTHLRGARSAAVLNSTVAVDALLAGVPVLSFDEGNPAHAVAARSIGETVYPERLPFLSYLASCQYFYSEIASGKFWEQLNPKRGPRLCDYGRQT
jgi:hypothetical protein